MRKSPFPGMDPFIESAGYWGDFHHGLVTDIQRALARIAPDRYYLRAGERSYIVCVEDEGKGSHPFVPDVSITTPRKSKKGGKKGETAAVAEAPDSLVMRAFVAEEHREAFVEIYEAEPEQR